MMSVFFLGQLVGLPTLHSILTKFEIKSNSLQINYKKLCKELTTSKLRQMFEYIFEQQLQEKFEQMAKKDSSCWSKELVTVVLDDSIFKQWLQSQPTYESMEGCYGCFFSGQYHTQVYGFKSTVLGVCFAGVLYPLYIDFVKKKDPTHSETSITVAQKLIKRWVCFNEKLKVLGIILPKIHFSCDSGYNNDSLEKTCHQGSLIYISVPQKAHFFEINQQKIKLSAWIETVYLVAEKAYQVSQEKLLKNKEIVSIEPFTYRFRAKYYSQNKDVTLLAFRLNGSKKVCVVYTSDKNIFTKTLRRHFFQRTSIEQFFKILKHIFKIQETRIVSKSEFEAKLLRFAFMAIHAQLLVRYIRRKIKEFKGKGFISIQRTLCSDKDFLDLLQQKINVKY
jgi:hypothetical protein